MNESALMKICLFGSILGIVALYFLSQQIAAVSVKVGDITGSYSGNAVNVTGEVENLKRSSGNVFFDLKDETGRIKVVIWSDALEEMELSGKDLTELRNGVMVNIIGTLENYKGGLEVIPLRNRIEILHSQ